MGSRVEIYSPEGLRVDGRRWNELRRFKCAINTHPVSCDGSSVVEQGNTKIICNVVGPAEPTQRARVNTDRVTISVKLVVAPFSTIDRRKRSQNDSRVQEMCTTIQHIFEDAVIGHLHPRSQIEISLYAVAQDGGLLQACVNAASLALVDAGVPMYDYVCACTAGIFDREVLLGIGVIKQQRETNKTDLNRIEESDMPFLTMATIGTSRKISLLQLEMKVQLDRLELMMAAAMSGCHHIRDLIDHEVRLHGKSRLARTTLL